MADYGGVDLQDLFKESISNNLKLVLLLLERTTSKAFPSLLFNEAVHVVEVAEHEVGEDRSKHS